MKRSFKKSFILLSLVLIVLLIAAIPLATRSKKPSSLAEANLGDGRIIRVEDVTFGKVHQVGTESLVNRFIGPWLPYKVREFFEPAVPRNRIERDQNTLVIWVNAVDPVSGTNVDCQAIKLDLIDPQGTKYGDEQPNWFGAQTFWRVGHVFHAFPRSSNTLTLRMTSWKSSNSVQVVLPNPGFTQPAEWSGQPLPQSQVQGNREVVLTSLVIVTNNESYWRSATPFWQPQFEIRQDGAKQSGWIYEWNAEDRYGNRGQLLGLTEPVLKFSVTFRPSATNLNAAVLVTRPPPFDVTTETNTWWNLPAMMTSDRLKILGVFPAGVHTFDENGVYLTNPPVQFAAVRGGAKSGWVSQSRRVTPSRTLAFYGHYSDAPVIYVQVADTKSDKRFAVRLVGEDNQAFLAEPESQGTRGGIIPFVIRIPPEVKTVKPELVFLPALKAEFLVKTSQ